MFYTKLLQNECDIWRAVESNFSKARKRNYDSANHFVCLIRYFFFIKHKLRLGNCFIVTIEVKARNSDSVMSRSDTVFDSHRHKVYQRPLEWFHLDNNPFVMPISSKHLDGIALRRWLHFLFIYFVLLSVITTVSVYLKTIYNHSFTI